MFGLGFGEIVIVLVLALVLLGPQRLPDAAKQLGKAMRDFQKATADVKQQFDSALYEVDRAVKPAFESTSAAVAASEAKPALVPPGGVPVAAGVPPASADNVPGLEAAFAEPPPAPAVIRARPAEEAAPAPEAAAKA